MTPAILLKQIAHQPTSGRLLARQIGDEGNEALVGVIHFSEEFKPREGALYIAACSENGFYIIPDEIAPDLPEDVQGYGVNSALRSNCWRKTSTEGTLTVRFVEAFPESNGWAIYGASNLPIFPADQYHRGHTFQEVKQGSLRPLPVPENLHGITPAQLLSTMPLWPNADGVLHSVPTTEARWRKAYHDYSLLRAKYGAGEITEDELNKAVKADPKIDRIKDYRLDEEFCRYLAAMRDAGALHMEQPRTAEEIEARDQLSLRILKKAVAATRISEMAELADKLKDSPAP